MQVSWIDPDEVRELLKQLEGPKQSATASAWEVHTLPAAQVPPPAFESLISEGPPIQPPVAEPHPIDPPLGDGRPAGPANAELWRIRERLRVLRDKAQTAGILSRTRPEPAAPPPAAEIPSPEPEPASPPASSTDPEVDAVPMAEATTEPAPSAPFAEAEPDQSPPPAPAVAQEEPVYSALPVPEMPPPPSEVVPIDSPFGIAEPPPPVYEPLFSSASPVVSSPPASEPAAMAEPPPPPSSSDAADLPFTVSNLGLSERLNAVAEWVCSRLGTREVLLVDDYGDVLWGAQGQTALVLSAMMAWHSAQRASASATCIDPERIDRPLAQGRSLTVLPLRTRYGVVSLAVIHDQPVGEADAAAIRRALAVAVEGTTSTGGNEAA